MGLKCSHLATDSAFIEGKTSHSLRTEIMVQPVIILYTDNLLILNLPVVLVLFLFCSFASSARLLLEHVQSFIQETDWTKFKPFYFIIKTLLTLNFLRTMAAGVTQSNLTSKCVISLLSLWLLNM